MAKRESSKRGMTRKELKKPDEFIAFSQRALTFISGNQRAFFIGSVATALVIVGAISWVNVAESRAADATLAVSKALDVYNRGVLNREEFDPAALKDEAALKDKEELPFGSYDEKYTAAKQAFENVRETYSQGSFAGIATLMRASVSYDLGEFEAAIADYSTALSELAHPELKRGAALGLVQSYERSEKYDEALKALEQHANAIAVGDKKDERSVHEISFYRARILLGKGETEEARRILTQMIADTSLSAEWRDRSDNLLSTFAATSQAKLTR